MPDSNTNDVVTEAKRRLGQDFMLHAIGHSVRDWRRRHELSKQELAKGAGISIGMLSRIENATVCASLGTLQAIAAALGVPLTRLFQRYNKISRAIHVPAAPTGVLPGSRCFVSFHQDWSELAARAHLIQIEHSADVFLFDKQEGVHFITVLAGNFAYRHGQRQFQMTSGDSLTCDANTAQGVVRLDRLPVRFLSILFGPDRFQEMT